MCYRQRWQEAWTQGLGFGTALLGRCPSAMLWGALGPDLSRKVWAAVLELRAQPAHTGAHRKGTASQKPQKSGPQGQAPPVDRETQ